MKWRRLILNPGWLCFIAGLYVIYLVVASSQINATVTYKIAGLADKPIRPAQSVHSTIYLDAHNFSNQIKQAESVWVVDNHNPNYSYLAFYAVVPGQPVYGYEIKKPPYSSGLYSWSISGWSITNNGVVANWHQVPRDISPFILIVVLLLFGVWIAALWYSTSG